MKESKIQSKIIAHLEQSGAYVVKTIVSNRNGVPDLLGCYKGLFIGIEVKSDIGKASKLQEWNAERIKKAGGISIVAKTVEEVKELLEVIDLIDLRGKQ